MTDVPSFSLPPSCRIGTGVRISAERLTVGENVTLDDDVVIVGTHVEIGSGTRVGRGTDLRADEIQIGENSEIGSDVGVLVAERFEVGAATRMATGSRILCRSFTAGRLLYFGDGTTVGLGGTTTSTAQVRIGDRVTIGQFSILNANLPLEIGDGVGTGSYLAIWTHGYHFGHGPLNGSTPAYAPVKIGRNVWLGFQVTLLPGVTIGDDSMIAAGAVVTGNIPPRVLAGGVPAKVKKSIEMAPASDEVAFESVRHVLAVWQRELLWKGCQVKPLVDEADRLVVEVSTEDGADRVVVHLEPGASGHPPESADAVVVVNTATGSHPSAIGDNATVFDVRSGVIRGRRSLLVEDLRDQLRRHAMPCGDDSTFRAIEPEPFRRLREAVPPLLGH